MDQQIQHFFFNRIGFPFLSWASTLDPFPCLCHSFPSFYARTWCVACFALCTTAVTLVVTIVFEVAVGVLTVAVIDNGCGRHVVLISILTSLSLLRVSINHEISEHELIMLWSADWPGAVSSCHVHRALKHQRHHQHCSTKAGWVSEWVSEELMTPPLSIWMAAKQSILLARRIDTAWPLT